MESKLMFVENGEKLIDIGSSSLPYEHIVWYGIFPPYIVTKNT